LSNSTRKLLRFEIAKMLIAVKNKFIVSFIIIFGTLSFPVEKRADRVVTIDQCVGYTSRRPRLLCNSSTASYAFCCCFLIIYFFNDLSKTNYLKNYQTTDLRQIFRISRTLAVDGQSEISFSIPRGTLP